VKKVILIVIAAIGATVIYRLLNSEYEPPSQ
jgi:hypothetical protein